MEGVPHNLKVGNNEFEIVATSDPKIYFNQSANNTLSIRNVSVMPKTEKVIMSRQDLVFLETWHEKIFRQRYCVSVWEYSVRRGVHLTGSHL